MTALNIGVGNVKPAFCTVDARRSLAADQHEAVLSWLLCVAPMAGGGAGFAVDPPRNKYVAAAPLVSSFKFYFFVTRVSSG
jgi:hypothetical protein